MGTVIATFTSTGPLTYAGQHGLWNTENCAYAGNTSLALTLSADGQSICASLGNGERHTFTKATSPSAPTDVRAVPGTGRATVRWTRPKSHGNTATIAFVVTPFLAGKQQTPQTFKSTATHQVVTGLLHGRRYVFKVAAKNLAGLGSRSAASTSVRIR